MITFVTNFVKFLFILVKTVKKVIKKVCTSKEQCVLCTNFPCRNSICCSWNNFTKSIETTKKISKAKRILYVNKLYSAATVSSFTRYSFEHGNVTLNLFKIASVVLSIYRISVAWLLFLFLIFFCFSAHRICNVWRILRFFALFS